ncbi:Uncharacterised protein [Vibrio metschnikovii]|nr:hypothetical protein VIB_000163 [Vibrio metschnikovii CIP 69.14]SUP46879.1 Uncharacterised protein [Vibrio metschnikovii]SUQ10552.1 Uncharacterised protein [Vibrio metschnikovii]
MFDLSIIYKYLGSFIDGFEITASVSALSIIGSFLVGLMVMGFEVQRYRKQRQEG